jgi:putative hydrolase of HD superfamily
VDILKYFFEINKIKDVKRYTPHDPIFLESVADHSFLMIVMATKFIDELKLDLDYKRVVKLAMHHDYCEIGLAADYDSLKASKDKNYKAEKSAFEKKNITELAKKLGGDIAEIYEEYEKQQTPESRFVKALDKLEACVYEMTRGVEHFHDPEFIALYPKEAVNNFPPLLPFYKELLAYMKPRYLAAGYNWPCV